MNIKKNIEELEIEKNVIKILNENNIFTIEDIWKLKRTDVKKMGIKDSKINIISIKLQLLGLDFNKKIYNCKR